MLMSNCMLYLQVLLLVPWKSTNYQTHNLGSYNYYRFKISWGKNRCYIRIQWDSLILFSCPKELCTDTQNKAYWEDNTDCIPNRSICRNMQYIKNLFLIQKMIIMIKGYLSNSENEAAYQLPKGSLVCRIALQLFKIVYRRSLFKVKSRRIYHL